MLMKQVCDLLPGLVDRGRNYMAGGFSCQLHNVLAKVCFDHCHTGSLQHRIKVDLFGDH